MMSGMSLPRDTRKIKNGIMSNSMNSIESIYTTSSSKYSTSALHRRKVTNRPPGGAMPVVSDVKKRVMSARMQRVRQLQNQLGDAQTHIAELEHENKILKQLYKRQDTALSKYENTNAELPQLLHSHAEEVRVWQTKCKNLQNQNKEMQDTIKRKDAIVLSITDQNKHLLHLNKEKNLEERERLAERVKELENRLQEKDNDSKILARRLQLETKNLKTQLHNEALKYRELSQKTERAYMEIARCKHLIEAYEKKASPQALAQSTSNLFGLSKGPILKNVRSTQARSQLLATENSDCSASHQLQAPTFPDIEMPNLSSSTSVADSGKTSALESLIDEDELKNKSKLSKIPQRIYNDDTTLDNKNKEARLKSPTKKGITITKTNEEDDDMDSNDGCSNTTQDSNRDKFRNGLLALRQNIEGFGYDHEDNSDSEHNYDGDDYDEDSDPNTDIMHGDVSHGIPRAELFDHRKHINEIEQKLNGTALIDTKSFVKRNEFCTDQEINAKDARSKKDLFNEKKELAVDLELLHNDMRANLIKKENLLDSHCDDLNQDPFARTMSNIINSNNAIIAPANGKLITKSDSKRVMQPQPIELKKKNQLLAALKEISG